MPHDVGIAEKAADARAGIYKHAARMRGVFILSCRNYWPDAEVEAVGDV